MCRVNSFLGCIRLETFALFIGWFYMILLIIGAFISILAIIVSIIELDGVAIAISLLVLILCFLMACICKQLVEGVETRNSEKVQKYRIFCFFGVVCGVLQVLNAISKIRQKPNPYEELLEIRRTDPMLNVSIGAGIIISLMSLVLLIYVFICIDSLYKMFGEEKFPQNNPVAIVQQGPYLVNYQPSLNNLYLQQAQVPYYYSSSVQKN